MSVTMQVRIYIYEIIDLKENSAYILYIIKINLDNFY
jgi:hypothetical protein